GPLRVRLERRKRNSKRHSAMSHWCRERTSARLFDHFVRAGKEHHWHVKAKHLGRFQVDDEFEFGLAGWQGRGTMNRFTIIALSAVMLAYAHGPSLAAPADEVNGLIGRWAEAFNSNDAQALAKLYA